MQADKLDIAIQETKKATSKPLLINFFIPAHISATAAQIKLHVPHAFRDKFPYFEFLCGVATNDRSTTM